MSLSISTRRGRSVARLGVQGFILVAEVRVWYIESVGQDSAIIDDILEPLTEALTPEAASVLADFKVSEAVRARVSDLAARANEGELTDAERSEYETHVRYASVLSVIKAKARSVLAGAP